MAAGWFGARTRINKIRSLFFLCKNLYFDLFSNGDDLSVNDKDVREIDKSRLSVIRI